MKLSNISVIFIIIVLPIILVFSYYTSLQIDTLNMQNAYTTKQLQATKEAIEAFEINTVEWNEGYSANADSKRRDIMASINTFTTSFANNLGIGGAMQTGYIYALKNNYDIAVQIDGDGQHDSYNIKETLNMLCWVLLYNLDLPN